MTTATHTIVTCAVCDWQPDPARRMAPDNQVEEHTKSGHVTVIRNHPRHLCTPECHDWKAKP